MRILLTFISFFLIFDLSAQTEKRQIELSGLISDKYPVHMFLSVQNNKVVGYYFYNEYKTKILLEGYQEGKSLILMESPDWDQKFSIGFKCEFRENHLVGSWIDSPQRKRLNVLLSIDSEKMVTDSAIITKIEGNYQSNSGGSRRSVVLQNITGNLFCFRIVVGRESGCTGYLEEIISLTDFKNGIYTDKFCKKLQLTVDSDLLIISEERCDWHGASCSFEGKYQKQ
jgi:hypothetical protein